MAFWSKEKKELSREELREQLKSEESALSKERELDELKTKVSKIRSERKTLSNKERDAKIAKFKSGLKKVGKAGKKFIEFTGQAESLKQYRKPKKKFVKKRKYSTKELEEMVKRKKLRSQLGINKPQSSRKKVIKKKVKPYNPWNFI